MEAPVNCSCITIDNWVHCLSHFPYATEHHNQDGTLVDVLPPPLWVVMAATITIVIIVLSSRWVFSLTYKRTLDWWNPSLQQSRHRRLILPPQAILRPYMLEKRSLTTRTRALLTPKRKKTESRNGERSTFKPCIDVDLLPEDSMPLLVFVNRKSGGQKGAFLFEQLLRNLNPYQVFDVANNKPQRILKLFSNVPNLRILVCGGDGTIRWILNTIEELNLKPPPPVAVIPMGTGNDLARVLGWGPGYSTDDNIPEILACVKDAHRIVVDRWEVQFKKKDVVCQEPLVFNNYFGIGVDAKTALRFHETRNLYPEWFFSRITNKFWYVLFGAKEIVDRSCAGLSSSTKIICDGVEQDIPIGAEGIILLNINSFAGGVRMWKDRIGSSDNLYLGDISMFSPSSMQDGMVDVVAVNGSFHLGEVNVGLARPAQICQGKEIIIETTNPIAMQVDGEPWIQTPCTITVTQKSSAEMLRKTADTNGEAALRMQELLAWALDNNLLLESQHSTILREMSRRSYL